MPKVLAILAEFKDSCKRRGWRASENEDWIKVGDDYHDFLWARNVHISSFKRITMNKKCVVREPSSYHVVKSTYTAWLFPEPPSETVVKTIVENSDFSSRIALYDLSHLFEGKNVCAKLNRTDSPVFREFESFLKNKLKLKLEPLPPLADPEVGSNNYTIAELA